MPLCLLILMCSTPMDFMCNNDNHTEPLIGIGFIIKLFFVHKKLRKLLERMRENILPEQWEKHTNR